MNNAFLGWFTKGGSGEESPNPPADDPPAPAPAPDSPLNVREDEDENEDEGEDVDAENAPAAVRSLCRGSRGVAWRDSEQERRRAIDAAHVLSLSLFYFRAFILLICMHVLNAVVVV
jgi:hypothetical protein